MPTLENIRVFFTLPGFAREKNCELRLLDIETFGGFGYGVRKILRQAADQLSNKLSFARSAPR